MNLLRLACLSPIVALAIIIFVALIAAEMASKQPPVRELIVRAVVYAAAAAAISLGGTIAWMIWYERSTGYGAGNAPLGWIFFYGPLSAAAGEIVALIHWTFRRVASHGDR
jgi:hypothetical protein